MKITLDKWNVERRIAAMTEEQQRKREISRLADAVCYNLGIIHHHLTLVAYIGDGCGENNFDAVKRWLDSRYDSMLEEHGMLSVFAISDIFKHHLYRNAPPFMAGE